jgi:cell migration-inducing and hyaluronan-binding protein
MDKGSWVIFELPGFTTAASGKQENSLDALRKSSETAYFKDKDALWVKLVSPVEFAGPLVGQVSLSVSRDPAPAQVAGVVSTSR